MTLNGLPRDRRCHVKMAEGAQKNRLHVAYRRSANAITHTVLSRRLDGAMLTWHLSAILHWHFRVARTLLRCALQTMEDVGTELDV